MGNPERNGDDLQVSKTAIVTLGPGFSWEMGVIGRVDVAWCSFPRLLRLLRWFDRLSEPPPWCLLPGRSGRACTRR